MCLWEDVRQNVLIRFTASLIPIQYIGYSTDIPLKRRFFPGVVQMDALGFNITLPWTVLGLLGFSRQIYEFNIHTRRVKTIMTPTNFLMYKLLIQSPFLTFVREDVWVPKA